jgi:hypothetical protein
MTPLPVVTVELTGVTPLPVLTVELTDMTPLINKNGNESVTLTPGHFRSMTTRTLQMVTNIRIV